MEEVIIVVLVLVILFLLCSRRDNLLSDYDPTIRFNATLDEVGRIDRSYTMGAIKEGCCGSCGEGRKCEGMAPAGLGYDKYDYVEPGNKPIRSRLSYELANSLWKGN